MIFNVDQIKDYYREFAGCKQSWQRSRVREVQSYLEARASEIAAMGYEVIRIPMPAPVFTAKGKSMFRSYSNSLLVNETAMVPRYLTPAKSRLASRGQIR